MHPYATFSPPHRTAAAMPTIVLLQLLLRVVATTRPVVQLVRPVCGQVESPPVLYTRNKPHKRQPHKDAPPSGSPTLDNNSPSEVSKYPSQWFENPLASTIPSKQQQKVAETARVATTAPHIDDFFFSHPNINTRTNKGCTSTTTTTRRNARHGGGVTDLPLPVVWYLVE